MPAPISPDLRKRVIAAWKSGMTWTELAERFDIGLATVDRLVRRYREKGSVEPEPHGGGKATIIADDELGVVTDLLKEKADRTLAELVDLVEEKTGKRVSIATMQRVVKRAGFSRKKKSLAASERTRESVRARRKHFMSATRGLDPRRLVFIDETGSNIAMTREYGWGQRGRRVVGRVPRNRGTVTTVIGALRLEDGLVALMTTSGGTSGEVFKRFVNERLVPILRSGDIVVMDNLGAHHCTGVREAIEAAGASVLYMPPYSPDLNPIEECWSKVKAVLKALGARTVASLLRAIETARKHIAPADTVGWFIHAGYLHQPA